MKIIWSLTARKKIKEILEYISEDNPDAALALIDLIEEEVEKLKKNPQSGSILPEVNSDRIRKIVVQKNYGVIYEISPDLIEILTIRHFRQNFSATDL